MKLGTHANTLTIVLMLLITGLAGCIGEGEAETEQQTIAIAGSSTVFPVASAWGQAYSTANDDYTVTVAGGGSGAGASKVCSTDADSVNIGDMSRGWKDSEATVGADGYTYSCVNTDVTITQLVVAYDGLSVVMKRVAQPTSASPTWMASPWPNSAGFSVIGAKRTSPITKRAAST